MKDSIAEKRKPSQPASQLEEGIKFDCSILCIKYIYVLYKIILCKKKDIYA